MVDNPHQLKKEENIVVYKANKCNVRGRPKRDKTILFSPQPKSIVAQLLVENRIVPCDTTISLTPSVSSKDSTSYREKNRPETQDVYTCEHCPYKGESMHAYKRHIITHKQFNCSFNGCNYTCKLLSNLIKHKRVHTDEKPYLCDICSFRTNFVNSLKAHRRTHTMERPYPCRYCDYKCNSSSNLKKHCLQKHSESFIK